MNIKQLTKVAGAVAIVLGLSACGGGSGGGSASGTAGTASVGTITGFGSVFVNGVEFQTNSANITIDGVPATENDLAVGMVAHLNGSSNGKTGVAVSINVRDELEGAVQSNSVTLTPTGPTGSMVVMGQTVTVDANTLFESKVPTITSIDLIAPDNIVEVNGYSDGNGNTVATRIEVKAIDILSYGKAIEVKGVISNLDTVAKTFTLGNLKVDYSGTGTGSVTPADGLYVQVKSNQAPVTVASTTTLTASSISVEDDGKKGQQGSEGEDMEIQGIIASVSGNSIQLQDGTTIITDTTTKFEDNSNTTLAVGITIKVEGQFNAAGDLVARQISLEDTDIMTSHSELKGLVSNVTATDVNTGTVTLNGSTFQVTSTTIMRDSRSNGVHRFNLKQLETAFMNGESVYVDIHFFTDSTTGNLIALKLERDTP